MDVQRGMLDRVKMKAAAISFNNIEFIHAGLNDTTLETEHFDRALLMLGEFPERAVAIKEIYDALKPGGIVSVTEGIFDPNFQRRSTITELACAVGFGKLPFSAKILPMSCIWKTL